MDNAELWEKYTEHLNNVGISKNRVGKLKSMHLLVSRHISKSLLECTREDFEIFIKKLHTNQIKSLISKKPLSGSTKADVKKYLKQLLKHFLGNDEQYPPQVAWLKTRIAKEEKPIRKDIVKINDIVRVADQMGDPKMRILTLLLFDSGFRIDEALSVKKCDLTWEPYQSQNSKGHCWWLRCNRSKTEPRKIPVPIWTEDINHFIKTSYFKELGSSSLIWSFSYENYLKILHYASIKVLKKRISPHVLRHSSATYYGPILKSKYAMDMRFGWSFGGRESETYVRATEQYLAAAPDAIHANETIKLQNELDDLKKKYDTLADAVKNLLLEKSEKHKEHP